MAAKIFATKGYFVAENSEEIHPGNRHNPEGYWEADSLIEANVDVLRAVGYDFHNTWLFEPLDDGRAKQIGAIEPLADHRGLVASYDQHPPWLWKDPRLCYLLRYWWPLIAAQSSARVLVIRRDFDDVFASFLRRGWRDNSAEDRTELRRRVDDHMRFAEQTLRELDIPHLAVHYNDFDQEPEKTSGLIGEFFELELGPEDLGYRPSLNHTPRSLRGRLRTRGEQALAAVPPGWRQFVGNRLPWRTG